MNKPNLMYFEQDDVLHLIISDEPEGGSVELSPNITAELNEKGELIGIEILNASAFIGSWGPPRPGCSNLQENSLNRLTNRIRWRHIINKRR